MTATRRKPAVEAVERTTARRRPANNDNPSTDLELDQYYTREDVAAFMLRFLEDRVDIGRYLMVEPSAGTGSFLKLLPEGSLAYDIDPKYPGIRNRDFLEVTLPRGRPIAVIGNPPFGTCANMAVAFFNHAAPQVEVIALILPRSFRKALIQNRLNRSFHLLDEVDVPKDAFLFRSKPYDVPAVFQIWVRGPDERDPLPTATTHPDFEFLPKSRLHEADFCIQRVGANAGRIHHEFWRSDEAHYFMKGDVEAAMRTLDFKSVTGNVAGKPSLAKSEIVTLYQDQERAIDGQTGERGTTPSEAKAKTRRTNQAGPRQGKQG